MPELPEVETVRRDLKKLILNKKIKDIEVFHRNIISNLDLNKFISNIKGESIKDIKRRGKWLIFELENHYLLAHLRMEGKFKYKEEYKKQKHDHVIFTFIDKTHLIYEDVRKFGKLKLIKKSQLEEYFDKLGPEPFEIRVYDLKEKFKNKSIPIKTAILDQNIISGIGNIYADEILFKSKISPLRKANEVSKEELANLIENAKVILLKAIENRGTTIRTYTSNGAKGKNQETLYVYKRENEPCLICQNKIKKIKVNGRGTHYCENCQK